MRTLVPILTGFLALNAIAVIATPASLAFLQQREVQTPARVPPPELTIKPATKAVAPTPATTLSASTDAAKTDAPEAELASKKDLEAELPVVPSLQTPSDSPNLPALPPVSRQVADAESLAQDPVFQEIKKMFQSSEVSEQSPPMLELPGSPNEILESGLGSSELASERSGTPSEAFFDRLDTRMDTVTALCQAAQSLHHEAAMAARERNIEESRELLSKATQLRAMAADLLIRRLP